MPKEQNSKETLNPLHSKKYYQSNSSSLLLIQAKHLEKLYEFNNTRPSESKKREDLLKEMFGGIGKNCYIEPPLRSNWGGRHVFFGDNVYANFNLTLVDDTFIYVGSHTKFAPNVIVATASHPASSKLRDLAFQINLPVTIGKSCWIGSGAIILPGVTIGDNTIIGAGSIVTKDIPANVIAVGNPCRVLRPITEKDYLDAQNNMF